MSKWKVVALLGATVIAVVPMLATTPPAFAACGGIHIKGNNGFGNGGFDGVPGRSAENGAPNAGQKNADVVR